MDKMITRAKCKELILDYIAICRPSKLFCAWSLIISRPDKLKSLRTNRFWTDLSFGQAEFFCDFEPCYTIPIASSSCTYTCILLYSGVSFKSMEHNMFKMSGVCIVVLGFKTFNRMTYTVCMRRKQLEWCTQEVPKQVDALFWSKAAYLWSKNEPLLFFHSATKPSFKKL